MIKERLLFILKYWIYWLLFFFLLKTLFILYNIKLAIEVPFHTLIKAYLYGLRLDISTSTYFTVLPFLITIIDAYFPLKYFRTIVKTYTIFLLVLSCILIIVDIELYKYWGFRLDKTPLDYIDTPKEMFASVNFFTIIKLIFIGIVLWIISYWVFNKYILKTTYFNKKAKLISLPLLLIIFCSLLIPIRGGTGVAPINTGSAYYCSYQFANHSAINIIWNVVFSLLQTETNENPFISFKKEEAQKLFNELQSQNKNETISLISNSKPNIIVIILESFTSKAIPALGGIDSISITPRFNGLIKEGIFFNKFYCTGTRSDKGLLSLLTGFPALPNVLVMRFPEKTSALPSIVHDLKKYGYFSSYYYGGDIDFVSMRSFVHNAGFDKVVSMSDMPYNYRSGKWGVQDHYMFEKFFNDINNNTKQPFFTVFFTLSSHEPFEVPMRAVIKGNDDEHKFMNSLYYTDSCLGQFIDKAKMQSWWKNTLVVLVADHGVLKLGANYAFSPLRFHIPMLWIGGVVKKDTLISNTSSQMDLPMTLLCQLNIKPQKKYEFSNNILSRGYKGYAFCAYNSGFLFFTDSSSVIFDYTNKEIKLSQGKDTKSCLNYGKAYLQYVYDVFLDLK